MPTKRPTLAEFSPEVREDDIKTQRLAETINAANENYRGLLATPTKDHASHIASIADGGPVIPFADVASQKRDAATLCHDLAEAREQRHQKSLIVKRKALTELCKTFLPEQHAILKRMASGFVEAHAANLAFQELKDYLIGQGGLVGICLTDTAKILGHPTDRTSDFAMLLREFVSLGVLEKMPVGLK
jgi:hypothetical protein